MKKGEKRGKKRVENNEGKNYDKIWYLGGKKVSPSLYSIYLGKKYYFGKGGKNMIFGKIYIYYIPLPGTSWGPGTWWGPGTSGGPGTP